MVLRALFLRPVLHRPARFVVTVVGVAVGVAAVVATVSANRAAVASLRRGIEEISGRAALDVVQPGGVPDTALDALLPVTDLAVVAPVVDQIALVPALDDAVRVLGVDVLVPGTPASLGLAGGAPVRPAPSRRCSDAAPSCSPKAWRGGCTPRRGEAWSSRCRPAGSPSRSPACSGRRGSPPPGTPWW